MGGQRVAFIGLGAMGGGMAKVLVKAGFSVQGFDVDEARERAFQDAGGAALSPEALSADVIVLMVVNAAQVDTLLFDAGRFGPGGLAGQLADGAVVVNCATVAPAFAATTAARLGAERYVDAPVSGGTGRAASGDLAILASAAPAAFARADAVLSAMAGKVYKLGDEAGAGSAMKVVNQLLAGVHIAAAAEAITFGMRQGLEPGQIVEIINECAGNSWMMQNRGPHIVSGDYTPLSAVDIFVKDLGLVSDISREARFGAPLAAAALQQFLAASGSGLGREDDAAVAKVYARNAGLTLPGEDT